MPTAVPTFPNEDIDDLVDQLTLEEKISLLGAPSWWSTMPIPRLGIPPVRMSDGPNGVRGSSHFLSIPSQCMPCATSLASTFDTDLVEDVGAFLAAETKLKAAVVLLAPTCNIQRNPLGGRAFESFSEDPHLSGLMAAAYVNGLQNNGVAATIKHLVANDQEHERTAADSVVSERALREIYLYPFMLAQKLAKPLAFMTSYGRIDDVHCAENPRLLDDILRKEWGFDGMVMSDWYGTYSVAEALNAGLDLEMPGPPRWREQNLVAHMISSRKLLPDTVTMRAETVVRFVQRLAKMSPEVVYGDAKERTRDGEEIRRFGRRVAREGMVLLRNEGDVLPIESAPARVKKIAVLGPNAKGRVISGGGSAYLKATYIVSPWEGLTANAPEGVKLDYSVGCYAHKYLPTLEDKLTTPDGKPGWVCTFFANPAVTPVGSTTLSAASANGRVQIASYILNDTRIKLNDFIPPGLGSEWTIQLRGLLDPSSLSAEELALPFQFGLTVAGRAKLFVDGKLIIDNWTTQRPGDFFYGQGTVEEKGEIYFDPSGRKKVEVVVEYVNTPPPDCKAERDLSQPALMLGVRLGGAPKIDPDQAMNDAVELARQSDVAIIIGGLTHEWESEGFDRPSLDLPGRQAELIQKVAQANPRTVVVVQAGSAVDYSWSDDVAGIIHAWYSGNEVGNAIADVLYGNVNPSGRMPLTFPEREIDIPAWYNTTSVNGKIHYREDIFVGYKHYQARQIQSKWPFGSGLSYTTFDVSNLRVNKPTASAFEYTLTVTVTNTGSRPGRQVVQAYVQNPTTSNTPHVPMQLRAFAKTPRDLEPGESVDLVMSLDRGAFSFWDEPANDWQIEKGEYAIMVGTSSADLPLEDKILVKKASHWSGI